MVVVRPMRDEEALSFLEIQRAAVRGLAVNDYPASVIEQWAPLPVTDTALAFFRVNHDDEIRLIAALDGELVGIGALVLDGSELRACYVVPAAARKGVGTALVAEIERLARSHGLTHLEVVSSVTAEPFYRALGYRVEQRVEHVLRSGVGMAAVKMWKSLEPTPVTASLLRGISFLDRTGASILYRYLSRDDDLDAVTTMLHDAYAPLAAAGMRFLASHQDVGVTQRRVAAGETLVAVDAARMIGIVTLTEAANTGGSPLLDRPDVASVHQFAVRPSHQGRGIGATLLRLVEQRAREKGVAILALDTSEHASRLIQLYESKGYRFIEHAQWQVTNYRSVVMAKNLV